MLQSRMKWRKGIDQNAVVAAGLVHKPWISVELTHTCVIRGRVEDRFVQSHDK